MSALRQIVLQTLNNEFVDKHSFVKMSSFKIS